MMYYGDHPGVTGWVLMGLFTLLFWGVVIAAGYALLRVALERGRSTRSDARRLLDERLARGEIDADEYTRRRELLDTPARTP